MGDVILYKEDVDRLNFLLKNLIAESKVLSALLITKDTRVLSCQGTLEHTDTSALAALLVGSFASTQAIAGLIGETEFDTMSHSGKLRNVIISLVDDDTILASVYDNASSAQKILNSLNRHLEILRKTLKAIGNNTTDDLFASPDAPAATSGENVLEFEKETEDLFKSAEVEPSAQALPVEQAMNIPKPPETQQVEFDAAGYSIPTNDGNYKPEQHVGENEEHKQFDKKPLSSKDYDVYALNQPINHPLNQPMHSPETHASTAPGIRTETMVSLNYLKNKAREGAVYYKRDEAIFKKIFKSAKKKKNELKSNIS